MHSSCAIVVTTIAKPTTSMRELARGALETGVSFFCVGDNKTPAAWALHGCRFVSLEEQMTNGTRLGCALPVGHYSRKNVGYLLAIANAAECIVETDDDNRPTSEFWMANESKVSGRLVKRAGWANAYAFFTSKLIWPRGFPLEQITASLQTTASRSEQRFVAECPVQQGLANGDTDVDAVYRMTRGNLVEFENREPLILGPGVWCPFNSQNTRWWKPAFELMYLPSYCSFRMTDIWRSFVVQACLWANSWCLAFISPSVYQDRNPHNLLLDFEAEVPGYLNNQRIIDALSALDLSRGQEAIRSNMRLCYGLLIDMGLIGANELQLLEHWFHDLDWCRAGYYV